MLLSPYISHSSILAWRIPWTEEPGGVVQKVTESDTTELSKQQQQQGAWEMCLAQGHTHAKSRIQTMFSQLYMLRCSKYFFKGSLLAALGLSCSKVGPSSCHAGSFVVVRGISCSQAYGILVPQPGIEPAFPALQGGLVTTGPPGKSPVLNIL